MSTQSRIKIIYGAGLFGRLADENEQQESLEIIARHNVAEIDTATVYGESEKTLGDLAAPSKFIIHTKAPGFRPGTLRKDSVLAAANLSFKNLKTESVDIYYLHSPDPTSPIEETLDAIQELYKAGRFKRFGLSNFKPEEVRKIHEYTTSKGYVVPSVFQGCYNPVARRYEKVLFPLLRKLNIAFYAYSPLAGGFLVKSAETIQKGQGTGRWDPNTPQGAIYLGYYKTPLHVEALSKWQAIAEEAGTTKSALAYRWVTYNSILNAEHGDGILIGASSAQQLEDTLKSLEEGPLEPKIVEKIDQIWDFVKDEAHVDNFYGSY